ncbi:MAG: hypothetical protein GC172_04605 [Phycisphaera sp.]|nr:hypothetical protein [Phycisphaera sp.]
MIDRVANFGLLHMPARRWERGAVHAGRSVLLGLALASLAGGCGDGRTDQASRAAALADELAPDLSVGSAQAAEAGRLLKSDTAETVGFGEFAASLPEGWKSIDMRVKAPMTASQSEADLIRMLRAAEQQLPADAAARVEAVLLPSEQPHAGFLSTCALITQRVPQGMSIAQYQAASERTWTGGTTSDPGARAQCGAFRSTERPGPGGARIKIYVAIHRDKGYVLLATAKEAGAVFDAVDAVARSIAMPSGSAQVASPLPHR